MEAVEVKPKKALEFKPTIIGFFCRWCTFAASDLAGTSRMPVSADVIGIRVPCSGRVDPSFIIQAFTKGADGVLIGGCHLGDCHYEDGNYSAYKRTKLLQKLLDAYGIEPTRVRIEWISASEAKKYQKTLDEFSETIRELGPLNWSKHLKAREFEKMVV
jgi:F420-non-reducing hydrogenase iron-sulfur subunit